MTPNQQTGHCSWSPDFKAGKPLTNFIEVSEDGLAELLKDKARLDWLEEHHMSISRLTAPDMSGIHFTGQCFNPAKARGEAGPSYLRINGQTIRGTIDDGMKEGK